MTAREKEALIENAIKESNTISEECKQELLKYYQKKKLYMKNGVFSLEGDKKTYEDISALIVKLIIVKNTKVILCE